MTLRFGLYTAPNAQDPNGSGSVSDRGTNQDATADYLAVGNFDGTAGLPTAINDLQDFYAYEAAVEAKTTEISSVAVRTSVRASTSYLLVGGTGGDTLKGADPEYSHTNSTGDGAIWGRAGNDSLRGGSGNDTIAPGEGDDTLNGTTGDDTVSYFDVTNGVTVDLGLQGAAQMTGVGSQVLANFDNLTGSTFADLLTGDSAANLVLGAAGDDTVDGSAGGDDGLNGEGGYDTVSFAGAASGVTVNLADTGVQATGLGSETITNFEVVVGSAFADTLTGDANANSIQGGGGHDTIYAGGGDDVINNLLSHGQAFGQGGDDVIYSNGQRAYLDGGAGSDTYDFRGLIGSRAATLGEIGAGDTVSLVAATAYGASQFTAVEHFDGQMACEVIAKYHGGSADRTVYKFDLDGDGKQDHKIVAKGGHYDFSQFTGVDTSHLTTSAAHEPGGLVT